MPEQTEGREVNTDKIPGSDAKYVQMRAAEVSQLWAERDRGVKRAERLEAWANARLLSDQVRGEWRRDLEHVAAVLAEQEKEQP